ncbi:hypothetical protein JRQ81_016885 [Phrynocephalus forsythii]|uniref:Uncharacterized protein n=1 Tax=Phrynocephalus forsythii TaxID=171643 RepID=A0A9Q1B1J4_9SAUR|nr:hypothetical protein JRQ81_016885 [Phrynocephalus forsythii]
MQSISADLTNKLKMKHLHSVATQTCEIQMYDVSEQPTFLSPAQRAETNSASFLITDPVVSSTKLSGPILSTTSLKREIFFNNPLETLPKCAPHPPAAVHILSNNSQIAVVSKTSSYTRSSRIITGSPEMNTLGAAKLGFNEDGSIRNRPMINTVATQTSEPLMFPFVPMECSLTDQSASVPSFTGRELSLEKPLGSCLTLAPIPLTSHPKLASSQVKTNAAAAVSAAVALWYRLSEPTTYRSLLDALLITPIIKPLPPESRPSRKSTNTLDMQSNWQYDPLEPAQYTAASLRSAPENSENGADKPVSANATSVSTIKPTGQYAVKNSGWQSSNQPEVFSIIFASQGVHSELSQQEPGMM